jgi:hypothetical protein
MAKAAAKPAFAAPGSEFARRKLKLVAVSGEWLRIHHRDFGAIYFSKAGRSRWDAERGPVAAMCVGETLPGIVLERFGDQLRGNGKFLTHEEVTTYQVTKLRIDPAVSVADIRDRELFHLGADAQLFSGSYEISRQWSLAFMRHPQKPAGLLYNSRHDPARTNLVLFDRPQVTQSLTASGSWVLREFPSFPAMLSILRIGVAPPVVAPADPLP